VSKAVDPGQKVLSGRSFDDARAMNPRRIFCIAWLLYAQSRANTYYYAPRGLPEKGLIVDLSCDPYEAGLAVVYKDTARLIRTGLFYLRYPNESPFQDYFFENDADIVKKALEAARDILEHHGPGTPMRCLNLKFCRQGGQRRGLAQVGDWNGKDEYDTINLCPRILVGVQKYDPCDPYSFRNRFQVRAPMTLLHEIIQGRQLLGTGQSIARDYVYGSIESKILRRDALGLPGEPLPPQPRDNVDSYAQYAKAALIAAWETDKEVQQFCRQKGLNTVIRRPPDGLAELSNLIPNLDQDNIENESRLPVVPPNRRFGSSDHSKVRNWLGYSEKEELDNPLTSLDIEEDP
jgi:hypothetical protein